MVSFLSPSHIFNNIFNIKNSQRNRLLAPSLHFSLNPCRITTHWQDLYNVSNVIHNFVLNGIGKSLGKHSVETMLSIMNACID